MCFHKYFQSLQGIKETNLLWNKPWFCESWCVGGIEWLEHKLSWLHSNHHLHCSHVEFPKFLKLINAFNDECCIYPLPPPKFGLGKGSLQTNTLKTTLFGNFNLCKMYVCLSLIHTHPISISFHICLIHITECSPIIELFAIIYIVFCKTI